MDSSFSSQDNYTIDTWALTRPRRWLDAHAAFLALIVVGLVVMGWSYFKTLRPVTVQINQHPVTILTNQTTVGGVLNDAAISLFPQDLVFPALASPIPDNQAISIQRARAIRIQVDGDSVAHRTQSQAIVEVLREAGITLKPYDRVLIDGVQINAVSAMPPANDDADLLELVVQRAVPIEINDNGALTTFYTTAPTLGESLRQAGLVVYLGDSITPDLGTPIAPGWQVFIKRSREVTIKVDNTTIRTRTLGKTIADLLTQEGIEMIDKDYTIPAATELVRDGGTVQVMRVREEFLTESESIPYETKWQPDATMEIDQRKLAQTGSQGVKKRTIRINYENGREVRRTIDKEWIESGPVTQIINYGTKIVRRDLTLPDGTTTTYWRKIRVLATSYTAATSGKARTHPEFGITYTGMRAGLGIIAVDPRVINLKSKLYVPGYGIAIAGDTGGKIKGRRVDLGYDESNLVLWFEWVDVYLLDPAPPAGDIAWIIPDLPRGK